MNPVFFGRFSEHKFSVTYLTVHDAGYVNGLKLVCHFNSSSKLKIFMYESNPGSVLFAERINVAEHDFDKYYIYSNMPEGAQRYFANESRRESIKELVANGWQLPMISGSRISACSADKKPQATLTPENIKTTLQNLIALRIGHT